MIVVIILKIVSNVVFFVKFFNLIRIVLFFMIILVFWNLRNVMNNLIFVVIVNFNFDGIVLMIFLWIFEVVRIIKIIFDINVLVIVVCYGIFIVNIVV